MNAAAIKTSGDIIETGTKCHERTHMQTVQVKVIDWKQTNKQKTAISCWMAPLEIIVLL